MNTQTNSVLSHVIISEESGLPLQQMTSQAPPTYNEVEYERWNMTSLDDDPPDYETAVAY